MRNTEEEMEHGGTGDGGEVLDKEEKHGVDGGHVETRTYSIGL